ncbi:MAG TPA: hypothetical protein VH083_15095 [Myxococcales bacterium]|nr:hypothetical protein [Myxococcales bacterium]
MYDFLSKAAKDGRSVSEREVADAFGVDIGGVKKRFGLLTGNVVLLETTDGAYDCKNVTKISKKAFASAGSQGKSNTEYVRQLFAELELGKKNNDTMRERLLRANAKLESVGIDPTKL